MKNLSNLMGFVLFAVFSVTASAVPAVGDLSTYHTIQIKDGVRTLEATLEYKFTAVDSVAREYTQVQTTHTVFPAGQPPEVVKSQVNFDSALSDAKVDQILQMCAQIGGTVAKLKVAAGTFQTCALPQEGQTVWIAKVPFGFVKMVQSDANGVMTAELQSFVRGQ